MLIVTTDGVPGHEIRSVLGEVLGTALQADQGAAPQPGQGGSSATFRVTGSGPRSASPPRAGGEALDRLGEEARRKGANTVVGMRFDTAQVGGGFEVCAYGTAVWAGWRSSSRRRSTSSSGPRSRGTPRRTGTRSRAARRWPRATSRWDCTTGPADRDSA